MDKTPYMGKIHSTYEQNTEQIWVKHSTYAQITEHIRVKTQHIWMTNIYI